MAAPPVQRFPLPYVVTPSAAILAHQHVSDSDRTAAPNPAASTAYETVIGSFEGPEVKWSPGS